MKYHNKTGFGPRFAASCLMTALLLFTPSCASQSHGKGSAEGSSAIESTSSMSGCPASQPKLGAACSKHGLTCEYREVSCAGGQSFTPVAICMHGLFSIPQAPEGCPGHDVEGGSAATDPENPCSAKAPAPGSNCQSEGLHCFYGQVTCPAGVRFEKAAVCQNGKIHFEAIGCP